MKDYKKMWNDNKKFLQQGIVYYDTLLDHFDDKTSDQYVNVENIKANFQFHLDRVESLEKTGGVNK